MKLAVIVTFIISSIALCGSVYNLSVRSTDDSEQIFGDDPKMLAKQILSKPRWLGTPEFFKQNKADLISNIEVTNFLENNGTGLAFIRTRASNKEFLICFWMRRLDSGWEYVPYLSQYLSGNPFLSKWIKENETWLEEMTSKKNAWEEGSDSVW